MFWLEENLIQICWKKCSPGQRFIFQNDLLQNPYFNRIIEAKGLCVASHNRSSFISLIKMGCNFREVLATIFRAWKLVFSTRIVDPSHAINLTHVNRNRNTPMQLAVDHPSIPYWSLVRARSHNSMRESLKVSLSRKEILASSILPKNELENVNFCPSLQGQKFWVRFFSENWKNQRAFRN